MNAEKITQTLQWMEAIGIDEVIFDDPQNKAVSLDQLLKKNRTEDEATQKTTKKQTASSKPLGTATASAEAVKIAAACESLDDLKKALETFEGCELKHTAMNMVFGDGNPASGIMFIGEAPGADEDRRGVPFVGESGVFLSKILSFIGLKTRDDYYITDVVNWRPPGNRDPSASEIKTIEPFLKRHIELVAPKVIVTLGAIAAKAVLDDAGSITKIRGQWHEATINGKTIPVMPLLHPSFLLRQAVNKKKTWDDLIALKKKLETF